MSQLRADREALSLEMLEEIRIFRATGQDLGDLRQGELETS